MSENESEWMDVDLSKSDVPIPKNRLCMIEIDDEGCVKLLAVYDVPVI